MDQNEVHDEPVAMVLDVDSQGDADSALGFSLASSTSSIGSSVKDTVEENGRTYHKYKAGKYYLPNDESEQERLDLQNYLFSLTFDGKLALAPIKNPQKVLDIGTGTGIWAIEYAVQNPSAVVIGSDLSPIQPSYVPPNCKFEVDDAEDTWTYTQPFDYIHGRALFTCFKHPSTVFRNAYAALNPGGYFEMQEIFFMPSSIDDSINGTALQAWMIKVVEGAAILGGKDWLCTQHYTEWFKEAGFVDVVERQFAWPSNTWPKGKKQKEMGYTTMANSLQGLSAVTMAVLTRAFGWSAEEVEKYLGPVRRDIQDKSIHAYYPIYVVYGRKPL